MLADLANEAGTRREIEDGGIGIDVRGDEIEPEGAVMHSKRRRTLGAGDLVMVELHPVFFAPVRVVDAVGSENAGKKDARALARLAPSCLIPGRCMEKLFHMFPGGYCWEKSVADRAVCQTRASR